MDDKKAEVHCCVILCVVYESEIQVGTIHNHVLIGLNILVVTQ